MFPPWAPSLVAIGGTGSLLRGTSSAPRRLRSNASEVTPEPLQNCLEALHAVDRRPCARELVTLGRETQQLDFLAHQAERVEEVLALLDAAAEVLLRVQHEHGRLDVLRVRRRRALEIRVDVPPQRSTELTLEDPEDVARPEHAHEVVDGALRDGGLEP